MAVVGNRSRPKHFETEQIGAGGRALVIGDCEHLSNAFLMRVASSDWCAYGMSCR